MQPSTEPIKSTIHANGTLIRALLFDGQNDFISLTDIAKYKSEDPNDVIKNWLRNRDTIEFLGLWEQLNNPNFKPVEFDGFKKESGANSFTLSPQKWIESTNAIGIQSKAGRYGGTYAHTDIAFEFASWVSAEFKLYIIKDYQRLKSEESTRLSLDWNVKRSISKMNFKVQTDAIKEFLIPPDIDSKYAGITYANEADLLNVVLFGKTAKEWRKENSTIKGNIRDKATLTQLIILANLENINALLIRQGLPQQDRLNLLHDTALQQAKTFANNSSIKKLE
jgi:hypothetical protein